MFDEFTDEDFDRAYAYVLKGFAHFARAVVPNMKANRWGRIVTIGSGHAKLPGRRSALGFDYVLANTVRPAGLGLRRSLADALAPFGITVNPLPPALLDTGAHSAAFLAPQSAASGKR